ncbi:MAG: hypothetical protein ACHQXL_09240 [Candidatus Limnocylindrales bacterium]
MSVIQPGRLGGVGRTTAAALLAVAALISMSGAALAAQPAAQPTRNDASTPAPARLLWMRDFSAPDTYVGQFTYYQCVAASIQMMRNMITGEADHSAATQRSIWIGSRALSKYTGDGGADPYGWSRYLTASGSAYQIYAGSSMDATLHAAARAMAQSGRPGGITVYWGSHAWVLTGIQATTNPALTDDFTVLSVSVIDPLWTLDRGGKGSVAPLTWLTPAQLKSKFTPYHDPRRAALLEGHYVAIIPIPTAAELANPANTRQVFTFSVVGGSLSGANRQAPKP